MSKVKTKYYAWQGSGNFVAENGVAIIIDPTSRQVSTDDSYMQEQFEKSGLFEEVTGVQEVEHPVEDSANEVVEQIEDVASKARAALNAAKAAKSDSN